jgi:hypothetical protein
VLGSSQLAEQHRGPYCPTTPAAYHPIPFEFPLASQLHVFSDRPQHNQVEIFFVSYPQVVSIKDIPSRVAAIRKFICHSPL